MTDLPAKLRMLANLLDASKEDFAGLNPSAAPLLRRAAEEIDGLCDALQSLYDFHRDEASSRRDKYLAAVQGAAKLLRKEQA